MTANENANVTRNRMIRLLRNIRDLKSFATRKRIVYEVCGRNFNVKTFDALLNDTAMCNAIVVVLRRRKNRQHGKPVKWRRSILRRKFRPGRPALLYRLTRTGHALLRRLLKQQADERAAIAKSKEDARQAKALAAQARAAAKAERDALVAQDRRQAQDEEAAARATRQAIEADRHKRAGKRAGPRTPAQIEQFEEARASQASIRARRKEAEAEPDVLVEPERPQAPRTPIDHPTPRQAPALAPYAAPLPAGFNAPPPAPWGPAQARPAAPPIGGSSLIEKIRKAGYTINRATGKVLYGGTAWISPEEWRAKMPHIELS